MKGAVKRSKLIVTALISLAIFILSCWYTYTYRYYLRYIPLPLAVADVVNSPGLLLPDRQAATLRGVVPLGNYDMRTEEGLRAILNKIQEIGTRDKDLRHTPEAKPTFEGWLSNLKARPFLCTDGTLLFINAAQAQGLPAREWHLLPPGWPPGQGHSVAEYYNPRLKKWQLIDAQHAAIIRDKDGRNVDMLTVLRAFVADRKTDIIVDYGPFEHAMRNGARGATVEEYFYKAGLLNTPVLQLRQPTWFAEYPRIFGFSGHFVTGYPIILDGWTHDYRTILTKLAALLAMIFGVVGLTTTIRALRRL